MRISTGTTVNVSANTERWLSEIRTGRAFTLGASLGPTAANNSHVQLFNPVASGIVVLVRVVICGPTVNDLILLRQHNTALTTLTGNGINLLSGAAASVAEVRTLDNAGLLGTNMGGFRVLANSSQQFGPDWLFELGAGEGLAIVPFTVNNGCAASFAWLEV